MKTSLPDPEIPEYEDLEGAGFTVYLISELSLIKNGTIQPAFTEKDGNALVKTISSLPSMIPPAIWSATSLRPSTLMENHPFEAKYGSDYDIRTANRIVYVKGRGYYYLNDILAPYKDSYYSNETKKWDFCRSGTRSQGPMRIMRPPLQRDQP